MPTRLSATGSSWSISSKKKFSMSWPRSCEKECSIFFRSEGFQSIWSVLILCIFILVAYISPKDKVALHNHAILRQSMVISASPRKRASRIRIIFVRRFRFEIILINCPMTVSSTSASSYSCPMAYILDLCSPTSCLVSLIIPAVYSKSRSMTLTPSFSSSIILKFLSFPLSS